MQEEFICTTKDGELYFRDGRPFAGTHRQYVLEHAGSRGKVSAGQMWEFVSNIGNSELGILHNFMHMKKSKRKISRRMKKLIRKMRDNYEHMLVDVPGPFC